MVPWSGRNRDSFRAYTSRMHCRRCSIAQCSALGSETIFAAQLEKPLHRVRMFQVGGANKLVA